MEPLIEYNSTATIENYANYIEANSRNTQYERTSQLQ